MRKLIVILGVGLVGLSACARDTEPVNDNTEEYEAGIDVVLKSVELNEFGQLNFYVYLQRPDLGLKEPESEETLYGEDLPDALRAKSIHIKDGGSCDTWRFAHLCTVDFAGLEEAVEFEFEVNFYDGGHGIGEVSIPLVKILPKPEVVSPTELPAQGDTFGIKFKDIGADEYLVRGELCNKYLDDGINPCLGAIEYTLTRTADGWDHSEDELYPATVSVVDDEIEVNSEFPLVFDERVDFYVYAEKSAPNNGLELVSRSSGERGFVR